MRYVFNSIISIFILEQEAQGARAPPKGWKTQFLDRRFKRISVKGVGGRVRGTFSNQLLMTEIILVNVKST